MALCLHDLRLSHGATLKGRIEHVRRHFGTSLMTLHLVVDRDVDGNDEIIGYLKSMVDSGQLELVFHGVTHQCPPGTGGWLYWYHKNRAEFLGRSFLPELNRARYERLNGLLGVKMGVCPPCWIASREGWDFINSLSPLFIEKMLILSRGGRNFRSSVISVGSGANMEIFFLKLLASFTTGLSIILGLKRIRFVLHEVDLANAATMAFFLGKFNLLRTRGYQPVLQQELC